MAYFNHKKWLTPNTYDENFAEPKGRGVYLLASRKIIREKNKPKFKILYVGMSLNLRNRLKNHMVLIELNGKFENVVIFFRNHTGDISDLEKRLILYFNPPYNTIGTKRGL